MKSFVLLLIRVYQYTLSPDTGLLKYILLTHQTCRYTPRCSDYMYEAVRIHGIMNGFVLGGKRMLRCTPMHAGGRDPVPQTLHKLKIRS